MVGINREKMEERYGELGSGRLELTIKGQKYGLHRLMEILGLLFEDTAPIDAHHLEDEGVYAIRYWDGADRQVVAYEFTPEFRYVRELRVHIAEWLGDEYFEILWQALCPVSF